MSVERNLHTTARDQVLQRQTANSGSCYTVILSSCVANTPQLKRLRSQTFEPMSDCRRGSSGTQPPKLQLGAVMSAARWVRTSCTQCTSSTTDFSAVGRTQRPSSSGVPHMQPHCTHVTATTRRVS